MRGIIEPVNGDGNTIDQSGNVSGTATGAGDNSGSTTRIGPDGELIFNPAGHSGVDNGDGGTGGDVPRKRRGRKPGSRNATSGKTQTLDVNGVEAMLFSIHQMAAAITKVPELMLDKDESKQLAVGIANVARHYDVSASAKSIDIANLVMICAGVYGTRLFAFRNRMRMEAQEKKMKDVNPMT
jgi:hypothetical protein